MKTTPRLVAALVASLVLAGCVGDVGTMDPPIKPKPIDPSVPVDPVVRKSALLTLTASASPVMVSVGQEILLEVTVRNSGEATASGVVPTTPKQTGSGLAMIKT